MLSLTDILDVVPVDPASFDDWSNPPYSGIYDGRASRISFYLFDWATIVAAGTWIWGRGSCDDKSDLVASL